jgi:cation diffusion facilitator CzcD-associated flavoprotein CzcO
METDMIDVAIIGAGPYGLSIAAHLKDRHIDFRIFGSPMHTWRKHMPKGMMLKSEGFASSLYNPGSAFTLARYCQEQRIPYADMGSPVPLETFIAYGLEFQRRIVPELEEKDVISVRQSSHGFQLQTLDGDTIFARRVVAAVGLSHYAYLPSVLASLPGPFVTHSSQHPELDAFAGREVTVIGAGASATDVAALLRGAGASVQLVARTSVMRFHDPPGRLPRSWWSRLRNPDTGLGPGWRSVMCVRAPLVFRQMPQEFRHKVVKRHLGPQPAWFIKEQIVGKVPLTLGAEVTRASVENGRVHLEVTGKDGARTLTADHVIAATGYRVDLKRLDFLAPEILATIQVEEGTPVLSSHFESSVPGLYFVGMSAANTFGPLVRFAYGAGFTARRISAHFAGYASGKLAQPQKLGRVGQAR